MLELFPDNGLDRSLHVPVFVGLALLTFFAETLGWTFAGLVVPGYFAAVVVVAPATAALVTVEAVLTYALSALLGRWLPRTGAWSTAFGRERFFLMIVIGLGVRLAVEANLLPFLETKMQLPHSRELHSLGLVLVPLLANMFWNAGFVQSLPRVMLITGLTYLFIDSVLLRYTNFTVSRFEVANESVSLSFLDAPHAQFILLIGALLAARANVLYGWDYNGILVPALLSVAWYQPTKLVTTVVESLVVYGCSRGLAALPPLSGVLLVGTRRTLLTFTVGLGLKWIAGAVMMRVDPRVHMVDFLGFGYLLPTLLAVKMWNRNAMGTVVVPTVQVSITAFIIGNLAGYGLSAWQGTSRASDVPWAVPATHNSAAFELVLGQTAPDPAVSAPGLAVRSRVVQAAIDRLAEDAPFDRELLQQSTELGLSFKRTKGPGAEYLVIRPFSTDPDRDHAAPRVAVRTQPARAAPWLVIAVVDRVGSPTIAAAARLADSIDARAVALQSAAGPTADYDDAFLRVLAHQLKVEHVLRVVLGAETELHAVGGLPRALDIRKLEELLDSSLRLQWGAHRATSMPGGNATTLRLPPRVAELFGARALGEAPVLPWPQGIGPAVGDRLEELTTVRPLSFAQPSIEELRLLRARLAPAFGKLGPSSEPGPWERALAAQLRYRIARIGPVDGKALGWALFEPGSPERRGNATWLRRVDKPRLPDEVLIEAPAVRWETGSYRASMMMLSGIMADGVLIAGAMPNATTDGLADVRSARGVRSFYHAIHQSWLEADGRALTVQAIAPERDIGEDVVLSMGKELTGSEALPPWTERTQSFLSGNGFRPAVVDGSVELAVFEGGHNPAVGYATRFAPDSMLQLWLSPRLRDRLVSMQEDETIAKRLTLAGVPIGHGDVLAEALATIPCIGPLESRWRRERCEQRIALPSCDEDAVGRYLEQYTESRNPHLLRAGLVLGEDCRLRLIEDAESDLLWAVLSGRKHGWLVPLRGGPVERANAPCGDSECLRLLLPTGLTSTQLGGAP